MLKDKLKIKEKSGVLFIFFVILCIISACFNPYRGDGSTGVISINMGGNSRAAAWPPTDGNGILPALEYRVTLKGPTGTQTHTLNSGGAGRYTVAAGRWSITITAFHEDDSYGTGHRSVDVKAGQQNSVYIPLHPVIEMVWVPAGSFDMGFDPGGSHITPVHTVTLTRGFYMGKYEVTQDQYKAVMGSNPSNFTAPVALESGTPGRLPVEMVSWYDAIEFCNALSVKEGLTPYYSINKTVGSDTNNTSGTDPYRWLVTPNNAANGYRLPTEAQWEYAAKGGPSPDNTIYAGSDIDGEVAWYNTNSVDKTHEVGKLNPNGLGLYDMSGNVFEWCWDWYAGYASGAVTNPTGPGSWSYRVRRGWCYSNFALSICERTDTSPNNRHNGTGFRLVRP